MIYFPKCGTSTKLINESGTANLSCPSCGIVWEKFLEAMANDALWPRIVSRQKHEIVCPKCGYERYSSDSAIPRAKCPSCHVDYAESLRPSPLEVRNAETKACEFCGERIFAVAKKCKHCGGVLETNMASPDVVEDEISLDNHIGKSIRASRSKKSVWLRLAVAGIVVALGLSGLTLFYKYRAHQLNQQILQATVGSVSSAAAVNHVAALIGNGSGFAIGNCSDVANLEGVDLPNGFTISSKAISVNQRVSCTVFSPDGESQSFDVQGERGKIAKKTVKFDCYETGELAAKGALENFAQFASMDIVPSQIMESACSKFQPACRSDCLRGFKSVVKAGNK